MTAYGATAAALSVALTTVAGASEAQPSDGAYGRLDGDLALEGELAASALFARTDFDAPSEGALLGARLAASYLWSAGVYGCYGDGLGVDAQPVERTVSGGVELRPLFLGRFARDLERGPAWLDLWLDSLALGMGLYHEWLPPDSCSGASRCGATGLELSLGLELPLLARAAAPYLGLRGALRHPLEGEGLRDTGGVVLVSLGYRAVIATGLVDAGDARD